MVAILLHPPCRRRSATPSTLARPNHAGFTAPMLIRLTLVDFNRCQYR
jgi:hypothetical protein